MMVISEKQQILPILKKLEHFKQIKMEMIPKLKY